MQESVSWPVSRISETASTLEKVLRFPNHLTPSSMFLEGRLALFRDKQRWFCQSAVEGDAVDKRVDISPAPYCFSGCLNETDPPPQRHSFDQTFLAALLGSASLPLYFLAPPQSWLHPKVLEALLSLPPPCLRWGVVLRYDCTKNSICDELLLKNK